MSYVNKIVTAFDGVRPMARITGFQVSTVMSWKVRGSIPDQHKAAVYAIAQKEGLDLGAEDFVPFESFTDQVKETPGEAT